MGIAVEEGFVKDIEEPIGNYIPELKHTELADIPIKACLQMASGINFDEDKDMSAYSIRTLLGTPSMKLIGKAGISEAPYTRRRYLSINTEILGEVLVHATGRGLAMGGLCISLRDYARFARLYLNNGSFEGEFMAIGVFSQWIYVNPSKNIMIVKTGADPDFNDTAYELEHVEFFRAAANYALDKHN